MSITWLDTSSESQNVEPCVLFNLMYWRLTLAGTDRQIRSPAWAIHCARGSSVIMLSAKHDLGPNLLWINASLSKLLTCSTNALSSPADMCS
eukprot:5106045-Amphidinium_carterae.1